MSIENSLECKEIDYTCRNVKSVINEVCSEMADLPKSYKSYAKYLIYPHDGHV